MNEYFYLIFFLFFLFTFVVVHAFLRSRVRCSMEGAVCCWLISNVDVSMACAHGLFRISWCVRDLVDFPQGTCSG